MTDLRNMLTLRTEIAISLFAGSAAALIIPATFMQEIDESLINAISIVIGAAIAGLSLTAAAARPSDLTVAGARKLGSRLKLQIGFWFGFVKFGGLAVLLLIAGRGLKWHLPITIPRPSFLPLYTPDTSAWLILPSVTLMVFIAVRIPKIINAINDLVELGTTQHIESIIEKNKAEQQQVAKKIADAAPHPPKKIIERLRKPGPN